MDYKDAALEDRNTIARAMFRAWWFPFSHYGVIHGDPHLGNYTIFETGAQNAALSSRYRRIELLSPVSGETKIRIGSSTFNSAVGTPRRLLTSATNWASARLAFSRLMPSRFGPRNCGHHNLASWVPPVWAPPASPGWWYWTGSATPPRWRTTGRAAPPGACW